GIAGSSFRSRGWAFDARLRLFARLLAIGQNFGDAQQREFLAMPDLAARVFAPPFFERDDLRLARLLENFGGHRGAAHSRRPERQAVAAYDQDLAKLDNLAGLALYLADLDHILGGDPVLLAARFKDREHSTRTPVKRGFLHHDLSVC